MRAKAIACLFAKCASILSGAPAHADGWNWSDIRRFHIAGMRIIDPRDVYLFSIRLQPTLGVNVGDIVLFTE